MPQTVVPAVFDHVVFLSCEPDTVDISVLWYVFMFNWRVVKVSGEVLSSGRLIDHLRNSRGFDLDDVHAVVLDEADKLLRMGFIEAVHE